MKLKKLVFLPLSLLLITSCGEPNPYADDHTPPTINSFSTDSDVYTTDSKVTFIYDVEDDFLDKNLINVSFAITLPSGEIVSTIEDTYVVKEVGKYSVTLTAGDANENIRLSSPVTFTVVDIYSGWSNSEANYFNNLFGVDLPHSELFDNNYDVYQIQDFNYQAAKGVRFQFSSFDQELLEEYVSILSQAGYEENIYEEAYQIAMTPELTYVKAYSLHLNGDRYLMAMPYINQGALNINFQIFNYSITNTWNTEFVNTVISEVFQPLVPELAINKDNTEAVAYLTDYNWYFEGATMQGYLRAVLFNVEKEDIINYMNQLIELGYGEGSIEEFETTGGTLLVGPNEEALGYSLMSFGDYTTGSDSELPFFYIEIMCS